jgi:HAD superfamily hydrolase (TIGR01484 family)
MVALEHGMPALVFFDLDGTLSESKQPLSPRMAELLEQLLGATRVAVISGGGLPQFEKQVVSRLPSTAALARLFLLPTSGGALYEWRAAAWAKIYEERLSETEAARIESVLKEALKETGALPPDAKTWGPQIEYRGAQVSLSVLGQSAPVEEKRAFDPDFSKRRALSAYARERLSEYHVAMGGLTTIDVTKRGIDKAYGIRKLCERLGIAEKDTLYVGDELRAGGNDEAVFTTNAQVRAVATISETEDCILSLLAKA